VCARGHMRVCVCVCVCVCNHSKYYEIKGMPDSGAYIKLNAVTVIL
jgi:hypothetical protein